MLIFLLAIPIVVADISNRTIPNIYILLTGYFAAGTCFFHGFPNTAVLMYTCTTLVILNLLGMGMGDVKIFLVALFCLNIQTIKEILGIGAAVLIAAFIQILLSWSWNRRFPQSIALAPAIYFGLSLYLATSSS